MAISETEPSDYSYETLHLFCWNIGLNKTTKGFSEVRDELVKSVQSMVKQSIKPKPLIFLQESMNKDHVTDKLGMEDCHYDGRVTGKSCHRSAVCTPTRGTLLKESKEFTLTKYLDSDPKTRDLDTRTFAREVIIECKYHHRERKYVGSLIIVSTHIPYKEKEEKKMAMIIDFFEKMCSVANEEHKIVVVGGDFNLEISKWKANVEEKTSKRVSVCTYDPSPRRQGKGVIDTFAIVYPIAKSVSDCSIESCVPIYPLPLFGHIYESHDFKDDKFLTDYPDAGDVQYKIAKYKKEVVYTLYDLIQEIMKSEQNKATSTKEEANSQQISEDTSRDITMELQCTPTFSTLTGEVPQGQISPEETIKTPDLHSSGAATVPQYAQSSAPGNVTQSKKTPSKGDAIVQKATAASTSQRKKQKSMKKKRASNPKDKAAKQTSRGYTGTNDATSMLKASSPIGSGKLPTDDATSLQATPTSKVLVHVVTMLSEQANSLAEETDKQASLLSKEIGKLIGSHAKMTSFLVDMSAKLARLLAKVTASFTEMSAESPKQEAKEEAKRQQISEDSYKNDTTEPQCTPTSSTGQKPQREVSPEETYPFSIKTADLLSSGDTSMVDAKVPQHVPLSAAGNISQSKKMPIRGDSDAIVPQASKPGQIAQRKKQESAPGNVSQSKKTPIRGDSDAIVPKASTALIPGLIAQGKKQESVKTKVGDSYPADKAAKQTSRGYTGTNDATSMLKASIPVLWSPEQAAEETAKLASSLSKEIAELIGLLAEMTSFEFLGDMSDELARLLAQESASFTEISAALVSSLAERIALFNEMAAKLARSLAVGITKLASLLPDLPAKLASYTKYVQIQSQKVNDLYFKVINHDPLLAKLKINLKLSKIEQSPHSPPTQKEQITPSRGKKDLPPKTKLIAKCS